ncbi:MAG: 50S ribosomal protein L25 [Chloroflexota bacterium]|nr:50S ribosomal protein L25 [Chloroflexota bacterium]
MAQTYTLEAQARTVTGKKVGALRRSGIVPAVIYGVKTEPVHIQIPYRALQSTLAKAGGTSLIDVTLGSGKPYSVLAREVQRDIIRGDILHVDFIAVDTTVEIEVEVAVRFVNDAPAEKASLGIVLQGVNTIRVSALPGDLIDHLDVDLSTLEKVGDTIFLRDLKLSDKIKIVDDLDEMVAKIVVTGAAASEAAAEEGVTSAEPEVIGKGKKDEEAIED